MTVYRVKLTDGEEFLMEADMTRSAAPIRASFNYGDTWEPTPYQTADASHQFMKAADLVSMHFGDQCGEYVEDDVFGEDMVFVQVDSVEEVE